MKLAFLTPLSVEAVQNAKKLGYDAIEVNARWFDQPALLEIERELSRYKDVLKEHKIAVTSVAVYGPTIESPLEEAVEHYARAFRVARALGCGVVSGLTGRDNERTVEENIPLFQKYFGEIARIAEDQGVRIALEPWPGRVVGHGPYRWTNLATTPELWDRLFEAVPSPALGLEYDPSHLVWQGIDHLQAIRDYGERIYHLHAKDIVIDERRLRRVGVHGQGWWRFVLPGLGQINWPELFKALREAGYKGDMAVEHEDREFRDERWNEGLLLALKALRPLVEEFNRNR
ncbi:MAG: sugar phosphate isomerase/epimerase [Anaerolineae bacterium]|nr:sugar phosphate isomerase/epimerase [Anaerolineae bacterium]